MEPHNIIARDFAKNHPGREYSEAQAHQAFEKYVVGGGELLHLGNVLIFVQPQAGRRVEFHCMNGGTGAELSAAVNMALDQLASRFDMACTYYDNPRINEIMKFSKHPAQVFKIDGGTDRTYEARFSLTGAAWAL